MLLVMNWTAGVLFHRPVAAGRALYLRFLIRCYLCDVDYYQAAATHAPGKEKAARQHIEELRVRLIDAEREAAGG